MSDKKLFQDFPAVTTQVWEAAIFKDLKGADYSKKLITKTEDNIILKPYYRSEDLSGLEYLDTAPGEFPYVRGTSKQRKTALIRQSFCANNTKQANKNAQIAIQKGVTSIAFVFDPKTKTNEKTVETLLNGIDIEKIEINFVGDFFFETLLIDFVNFAKLKKVSAEKVYAFFEFDPMAYRAKHGICFPWGEGNGMQKLKKLLEIVPDFPNIKVLGVNASYFGNAGASATQQLGFALAIGSDYFAKATKTGISVDDLVARVAFTFSVGADYFTEIAKLRAARLLWAKVTEQYLTTDKKAGKMYIYSVNSLRNKTLYDAHVNSLRSTTEAMSALIGGCDSLQVLPFDAAFGKTDDFSQRIARNIQVILNEEAYFDKTYDPASGAYFIENLTDQIAEKAWAIFLQVEQKEGFVKALKSGFIQQMLAQNAKNQDLKLAQKREVLLGTNQYANRTETLGNFKAPAKKIKEKYDSLPLNQYRLAEPFEKLRLSVEKLAEKPRVFLLTFGSLTMRKARAAFAANFFSVAGYQIIENNVFSSAKAGVQKAKEQKADIIVLCSEDTEYLTLFKEAKNELNEKNILVIAGYPSESMDELTKSGAEYFIHTKSNLLETLQDFNKKLGLK